MRAPGFGMRRTQVIFPISSRLAVAGVQIVKLTHGICILSMSLGRVKLPERRRNLLMIEGSCNPKRTRSEPTDPQTRLNFAPFRAMVRRRLRRAR
jgi:hypothetical protein